MEVEVVGLLTIFYFIFKKQVCFGALFGLTAVMLLWRVYEPESGITLF